MLVTLFKQGRYAETEALARTMTVRFPLYGFGWKALGTALLQQGRTLESLASLQKATKLSQGDAQLHNNLGNTLAQLDRLSEAEASYRQALKLNPGFFEAHHNLGNTLLKLDRLSEAEASFRCALEFKPDYAEAHCNLGVALNGQHQPLEAEASYRRAIEIKPDYAEAHYNLGAFLFEQNRLPEAEASLRRTIELKPNYVEGYINLGNVLHSQGSISEAKASYRRALEIKPDLVETSSRLLFINNLLSDQTPELMLAEAQRYGELVARQARPYKAWNNVPEPSRRLRVGLVSGDLRAHPVGYFLESVMKALSSQATDRLEFFAYPSYYSTDAITERLKACCHGWRSAVRLSDEALARQIREDGIDILLDLSGHTPHNRLPMFAWKPAPIQATWLGYLATTGVAAMDYLVADSWTLPETEEIHFTEKIWRLPEIYICFTPPEMDVVIAPLPALTNGYITFGCFNNLTKLNDAVVSLWARLLASVPNSHLLLKSKQLKDALVRQRIVERFAVQDIEADRLILMGSVPRTEYLAPYQQVDIALDPFPYPGITTSVEALWMGVPVLTLAGERFLSRQGVGLLMNAGLPEWIAADAGDYVARAVSHAGDLQHLAALRSGLRQQVLASPIFDAQRFARHFEAALRSMWTQWCGQQQVQPL